MCTRGHWRGQIANFNFTPKKIQFGLFLLIYEKNTTAMSYIIVTLEKKSIKNFGFLGDKMEICHFTPEMVSSSHSTMWKLHPNVLLSGVQL